MAGRWNGRARGKDHCLVTVDKHTPTSNKWAIARQCDVLYAVCAEAI
jgi:hypothetical protein